MGADRTSDKGVVVSLEVAGQLDLASGAGVQPTLRTTQGEAEIAGVYEYPADGRRPGFGYGMLLPVPPTEPFDECWIKAWPQSIEVRTLIRLAMLPVDEAANTEQPIVSQLNTRNGVTFNGHAEFEKRVTRFGGLAALAAGTILGFISVRIRRLEFASARHSGVTGTSQAGQVVIESTVTAVISLALATSVTLFMSHSALPAEAASLAWLGLRPPLIGTVSFVVGACAGVATTKEKHLFRYFKNR
jgi:hypothetical protein